MVGIATHRRYLCSLFIVIIAGVIWFSFLGYRDLIEPDEGRYAEIPREMVATGDWITPRLNGFKYFEKPAFQYWATAISYKLFGQSNATARLWTASFGFLCALFVWYVGAIAFGKNTGFYAFLLTISSFLFTALGHILTLDMSVSVFLVMAIGSLVVAQKKKEIPSQALWWSLLSWCCLAGAVLSKGLIGVVLPAGTLVIYSIWQRDWKLWAEIHLFKAILILLALTVPWFYLVCQRNEEFFHFFFIHEHWERYTTNEAHREGSFFYFIPVFLIGTMPWAGIAINAITKPSFNWRTDKGKPFDAEKFMWTFCVFVFLFFSFGHSKLPPYILPIFPVLAILMGKKIDQQQGMRLNAWLVLAFSVVLLVVGLLATQFANEKNPIDLYAGYRPWIIGSSLLLFLSSICLIRWEKNVNSAVLITSFCALISFQLIGWGFQNIASSRSSKELAEAIYENQLSNVTIYSVDGTYPQSLPFYIKNKIILTGYKGEMAMGIEAEPENWLRDTDEFIKRWKNEKQAVAVIKREDFDKFKTYDIPMRVIYDGPRRIAVAKN